MGCLNQYAQLLHIWPTVLLSRATQDSTKCTTRSDVNILGPICHHMCTVSSDIANIAPELYQNSNFNASHGGFYQIADSNLSQLTSLAHYSKPNKATHS